jgi:hypothetical protein
MVDMCRNRITGCSCIGIGTMLCCYVHARKESVLYMVGEKRREDMVGLSYLKYNYGDSGGLGRVNIYS